MNAKLLLAQASLPLSLLAACAGTPHEPAPRCSGACGTHDEGYEWAQRLDLEDARQCDGYAADFSRGCRDAVNDFGQLRPAAKGL